MLRHDTRRLTKQERIGVRVKVVEAVKSGMGKSEAARAFGVSANSVTTWTQAFDQGGHEAVKADRRGRPAGVSRRLTARQGTQLQGWIRDRTPDQLKLPFMLWTREAVVQLIWKRFGVRVSVWTAGRYLKEWGFTPQKPRRRAFEQDPEAVRQWLRVDYPAIVREAKRAVAEIHWGDEMGLRSDHQAGTSWSPKGVTPIITGTGQRFKCNMISTVTNRGTLRFMVFKERFTTPVFLTFLKRLVQTSDRMIFLIVDGHPVHKAAAVKRWLKDNSLRIRLFLLPAYAPEYNPDEFLNNDVKSNAVGRRRAHNQNELIADVRGYLKSTQRHPEIVQRYFHAPTVQYAS